MKILQDLFPAEAILRPATDQPLNTFDFSVAERHDITAVRIIVTPTHIIMAQDGPGGAQVIFKEEYDPGLYIRDAERRGLHRIQTRAGRQIAFHITSSCGCGSRLRSWNPYKALA